MCVTDKMDCCGMPPNRIGEWFFPNGSSVTNKNSGHSLYRDRGNQLVRLNKRGSIPTGRYQCEVLDANGVNQTIIATIIGNVMLICLSFMLVSVYS